MMYLFYFKYKKFKINSEDFLWVVQGTVELKYLENKSVITGET